MATATVDQAAGGGATHSGLDRARSAVIWVLLAEVAVLVATGVYLYFEYRPTTSGLPRSVYTPDTRRAIDAQRIHQVTGWLTIATAVPATVLLLLQAGRFRWRRLLHAVALPVLAVAGLGTGVLLPWDQVALFAVTTGSDFDGYDLLRRDQVRFVLQGGGEVSPTTLLRVLFVHVVVVGVPLAVLALLGLRAGRRSDPATDAG